MSCWVVPSIAAELWGVSVQQVLEGMNGGHIPCKTEAGFTFVDVAPNSPKLETPKVMRPPPPPTFTAVAAEEQLVAAGASSADGAAEEYADDDTIDLGDWREARETAERRRRPPAIAA